MNKMRSGLFYCAMLLLLLVLASPASAAPAPSLQEVVATLEQGYRLLADLQADFSQRTAIASMKREERGAGELFIKKAAKGAALFRFNYTKPRQQIISNGKKVWYYLPDNRQVMVTDVEALFSSGNNIALNYLTGMGNVSRDFSITFAGSGKDSKGNYVLELVPKKPNQMMAKLQLTLSARAVEEFQSNGEARDPFPILASAVSDQMGNVTSIEYSKAKVNRGLDNDRFNFRIPAGVEVIKQ